MKDKNKIFIISGIAAFVLIVVIILSIYFFTDAFKSNKELFNKYLIKSQSEAVGTDFIDAYIDVKTKKSNNSNSTSTDINLYEINANNLEDKTKIIGLNTTSLKDVNLKQDYKIFKLTDIANELATVKYVRDGDIHAVSADNILTRYIAIDAKNAKTFAKRLGIENTDFIPDTINEVDYGKLISTNKTSINSLEQKYIEIIINNIEEDKYTKVKNADKTESLILTLTNQDLANIFEKILQEARNDEALLSLIKENASSLGYNLDITVIQNKIDEVLTKLTDSTIPEGQVKIALVVKDKNVIKYIIETPEIMVNEAKIDAQTIELKFENNNRITMNIKSEAFETRIDITYLNNNNIISADTKIYVLNDDGTENELLSFKDEILNYNTDKLTETINVNLLYGSELYGRKKYELSFKEDTIFKQDIQIEKLTTENSTRVDLMTDEQLQSLEAALVQRILQLYGTQMNSLLSLQMN